nr:rhodanese-like domain-containing protein [Thalassobacillus pellis]
MVLIGVIRFFLPIMHLRKVDQEGLQDKHYCVIDIRDYISAHRHPFPGAENIPLSYLSRALRGQFDCQKDVLVVSDDVRSARIAANIFRKKHKKKIYYVTST